VSRIDDRADSIELLLKRIVQLLEDIRGELQQIRGRQI